MEPRHPRNHALPPSGGTKSHGAAAYFKRTSEGSGAVKGLGLRGLDMDGIGGDDERTIRGLESFILEFALALERLHHSGRPFLPSNIFE